MKKISKPDYLEYAVYYENYIKLVRDDLSVLDQLKSNAKTVVDLYRSLPEGHLQKSYLEGKWSMKDILMHVIDTERVFLYRAMRFARFDSVPLPYFDENEFAKQAVANQLNTRKLLKEYVACRNLSIAFFNNLNARQLKACGVASNFTMSVRACAWIICGHELHHYRVIQERYLCL